MMSLSAESRSVLRHDIRENINRSVDSKTGLVYRIDSSSSTKENYFSLKLLSSFSFSIDASTVLQCNK